MLGKVEQENFCLQGKLLCDCLRTKMLLISDFSAKDYRHYENELKRLKKLFDEIYWKE